MAGFEAGTGKKCEALGKKWVVLFQLVTHLDSIDLTPAADAEENWDKQCAECHGKEGKGDTKMLQKVGVKDYTDAKVQGEMEDEAAFKAIKEGVKDKDGRTLMKPGEGLSDDDIKALVKLVRGFKP